MNTAIALAAVPLVLVVSLADARDIKPEEALQLHAAGVIQSSNALKANALSKHPGATITDSGFEETYGKYLYEVELRDAHDIEWVMEIDAITGQILKHHQDR